MNNIDNNNFNELISGVEDCLKDSPFSDTAYFLDLLSQVDFLLIIRDIYDNNFCLSDGIVEKIISCGYRVCDVQAIISYAESGILDCNIIPIVNHKPLIKSEIEKEVEEKEDKQDKQDAKILEDKYFKYFFSCSEAVGVQADFYIKVSSNLLNINKLVFDLLSLMKAQYIMVADNEIRIQLDFFEDDNVSLIDGMYKFIPIEESKTDTYCIIYGEEKQLEFIFGFLNSCEHQIADRIYVENKFIELQRSINRLPKEMLNVKLDRIIEDNDALDFFKRNEKIFINNILEDMPLGINSKYIDELANGINERDTRSVSQAIIDTFKILKPSEEDVIRRRYFGESIATLESIGIAHNVSRERVRQIEAKSKEKITHQKIGKKTELRIL